MLGRKRKCDPLAAYVDEARRLISAHGFRSLLFLSDTPAAVANATAAFAPLGVRLLMRSDALVAARRTQASPCCLQCYTAAQDSDVTVT